MISNPEIWNPKNVKHENSQNPNPFCPKCWQGLDYPEKDLEGPIWGHPRQFSPWTEKIKNDQKLSIFLGVPMGPIHPVWVHVLVSCWSAGV